MSRIFSRRLSLLSISLLSAACLPQPTGTPDAPDDGGALMPDAGFERDGSVTRDAGEEPDARMTAELDIGADLADEDMTGPGEDMEVDMTPPPPPTVPVFVGAGDFGRRIISCDQGQTWQETASFIDGPQYCQDSSDTELCYGGSCSFTARDGSCKKSDNCDCDHSAGTPMGLTFAGDRESGGHFVSVFGWGAVVTTFVRSDDGIDWTESEGVVNTPAGVSYGDGVVMLGTKKGWQSSDQGETWMEGGAFEIYHTATGESVFNTRQSIYVPTDGGRFFITAQSGEKWGVSMSADGGQTWSQPDMPGECGQSVSTILGSSTHIVMLHNKGLSCVSTDDGQTFTAHQVNMDADTFGSMQGTPVHDGTHFRVWGSRTAYTSEDGMQWQMQERDNVHLGATTYDPSNNVFVAVRGGWQNWYDKQEFYRSTDGIQWQKIDDGSFLKSHRIRRLTFGWAKPGTVCPMP